MSRPNLTFFQRVDRLRSLPARPRVAALADALLGCSAEEAETFAPDLLELAVVPIFETPRVPVPWNSFVHRFLRRISGRQHLAQAALQGIARSYARLSDDLRAAARAVGQGRWTLVAPPLATDTLPTARRSLALLACETLDPDLLALLPTLLHDPNPDVARQADDALPHAVASSLRIDSRVGDPLLLALADAVTSFPVHRRRGPLVATIHALDRVTLHRAVSPTAPGAAKLADALAHASDDALAALRTTLQAATSPVSRRRAWEWLPRPALAAACVRRVTRAGSPEDHDALLAASHLIAHPARSAAWRAANPAPDLPDPTTLASLSTPARRGLPRLATRASSRVLTAYVVDPDPVARFAAAVALPPADMTDFAFDPDPRVAGAAATRLLVHAASLAVSPAVTRTRRLLARSPHPVVRALAEALDADSPAASIRRRLLERRAAAADPARWRARLIASLRGADPVPVLHAAVTIRALSAATAFAPDLLAASRAFAEASPGSPAARTLATLVATLGPTDLRDHAAAFLDHPDPRVRANAVEALARRGSRPHPALVELKPDPHHRARANLLRARLQLTPDAARPAAWDDLLSMLAEADPAQRLAGAWLASRLDARPAPVRATLESMALRDPDARVRRRAASARDRWSVPA